MSIKAKILEKLREARDALEEQRYDVVRSSLADATGITEAAWRRADGPRPKLYAGPAYIGGGCMLPA